MSKQTVSARVIDGAIVIDGLTVGHADDAAANYPNLAGDIYAARDAWQAARDAEAAALQAANEAEAARHAAETEEAARLAAIQAAADAETERLVAAIYEKSATPAG